MEGDRKEQNDAISITVDGARIYTVRHFSKGMNVYDAATGDRLKVIHEEEMPMWGRRPDDGDILGDADFAMDSPIDPRQGMQRPLQPMLADVIFDTEPDAGRLRSVGPGKQDVTIHRRDVTIYGPSWKRFQPSGSIRKNYKILYE